MSKRSEYYFKEGCFIEEWLNNSEHDDLSIARVRVEPKSQTRLHRLNNIVERYVMLDGQATVTVGDQSWSVEHGDVVIIEPGQTQKIRNDGDADLIFLAICTPRFQVDCYDDLETSA